MGFEALRDLPLEDVEVETPIETCRTPMILVRSLLFVPVLRAGLGMVNGITTLVPSARSVILVFTVTRLLMSLMSTIVSFRILSTSVSSLWLTPCLQLAALLSPPLTSSNNMVEKSIKCMFVIAAPEGLKRLHEVHPDVQIYVGHLDRELNDRAYICPGLGDAGDRIFGTK